MTHYSKIILDINYQPLKYVFVFFQPSLFLLIKAPPTASHFPARAPLCLFSSFVHCYKEISGALVLWPPKSLIMVLYFNRVSVPSPRTPPLGTPSEGGLCWPPSWMRLCSEKEEKEKLCILSTCFEMRGGGLFFQVSPLTLGMCCFPLWEKSIPCLWRVRWLCPAQLPCASGMEVRDHQISPIHYLTTHTSTVHICFGLVVLRNEETWRTAASLKIQGVSMVCSLYVQHRESTFY